MPSSSTTTSRWRSIELDEPTSPSGGCRPIRRPRPKLPDRRLAFLAGHSSEEFLRLMALPRTRVFAVDFSKVSSAGMLRKLALLNDLPI